MRAAIKPSFYTEMTGLISASKLEVKEEDILSEETQALYSLSQHRGWGVLDERLKQIEDSLERSVTAAMAAGASFDDIGQKTVVKEIAKYVIKSVRDTIGDAVDATEQRAAK
jgi:hypothetical protein